MLHRQQDASRFGALIQNPDWSDQLDPDRERPRWEKVLLDQIYQDLAILHGVDEDWLREETLDYHAFDWYHNPYTMGAFAHFAPGQYSTVLLISCNLLLMVVSILRAKWPVTTMHGSPGHWIQRCG